MTKQRTVRPSRFTAFTLLAFVSFASFVTTPADAQRGKKPKAPPVTAPAPEPATPPAPPAPPALSETLTGDAKADYDAGKLLFGDGDFAGALVKFTAAHEKAKDPRLLWNMAACEKNLRHYSNVLVLVRQFLAQGDALLTPADRTEAEALIKTLEPLTVELEVSVNEPGAKIFVDEKLVGESPLPKALVVDLGVRKVRVEKDGYETVKEAVVAGDNPHVKLAARLEKIVHEATLSVVAQGRDEIYLDGALRGIGTWKGIVPSGGHTLRVAAPEMRAYQAELYLRDKESRSVSVTLEKEVKPAAPVPAWVWIGGGALVLGGAAVAGYFIFKPEDKQPDLPVGTLDPGSVQASFPLRMRR
ncbi:MAG: PEGA domain-containing protein [Polyangiaceae bacterium]